MNTNSTRAFQQGGKIDPEELLRRMSSNYGVSNQSQPAPAPVPKPVVQPQPTPQPGSMLTGAANALKGRAAQIDKAAGYACGGKIRGHANGGKILGPGTPTSDSIPAQVVETGEPIAVSTDERIVSAEQEKILMRIAEMLGFPSVDAMFESLTGKPVGPTIKGGKKAAATGMRPGETDENGNYRPASVLGKPSVTPAAPAPADGTFEINGIRHVQTSKPPVGPGAMLLDAYGATLNKMIGPDVEGRKAAVQADLNPSPQAPAAKSTTPVAAAIQAPTPETQVTAAPTAAGPAPTPGERLLGNAPNGVTDDSASALRDQQSNNPYWSPAAQLERMQRRRMLSDATDPTITDPAVRETAQKGLLLLNATQAAQDKSRMDNALIRQTDTIESMRSKLLDPKTPPEERQRMIESLRAINGKGDSEEFIPHVVKGQIGEPDTLVVTGKRSGQPMWSGTGKDAMAAVQGRQQQGLSFNSPAELEAAKKSGKVKAGDVIQTPNGMMVVK